MTLVLVDSNILIDIATDDPAWGAWSADALARSGQTERLIINPLIYAEVSFTHSRIETLDALLPEDVFAREPLPWAAAFLASKAFVAYKTSRRRAYLPLAELRGTRSRHVARLPRSPTRSR